MGGKVFKRGEMEVGHLGGQKVALVVPHSLGWARDIWGHTPKLISIEVLGWKRLGWEGLEGNEFLETGKKSRVGNRWISCPGGCGEVGNTPHGGSGGVADRVGDGTVQAGFSEFLFELWELV